VVAVNAAVVAFVDELLRLPSSPAAATVVDLLYGRERQVPPAVLSHVNGGLHVPLASLLSSPTPLAVLVPGRLRISSLWRTDGQELKGARAAARARYRDLQAAFVASPPRPAPEPAASLVRYTYGADGRQWQWEEAAARLLHRVTILNRAVLDLLAAVARGDVALDGWIADPAAVRDFDLPAAVLDLMAATLPPLAVPDWARLAPALDGSAAVLSGEESMTRYRALLAEILGLQDHTPVPA
jgi:hypothetical protein